MRSLPCRDGNYTQLCDICYPHMNGVILADISAAACSLPIIASFTALLLHSLTI